MGLVAGDLYVALLSAGADQEKAFRAAAEALELAGPPSSLPARRRVGETRDAGTLILVYISGILTGLVLAAMLLFLR